jgi:hypothetical protein
MTAFSFGGTRSQYAPQNLSFGTTAQSPVLTFGGAAQTPDDTALKMFSGGGSFGSKIQPVQNSGGIVGGLSNFLSTLSFGESAAPVYSGRGADPRAFGGTFAGTQAAVQTAQIDGTTGWVSGLRDSLGSVLAGMGSSGDNSGAQVATPVAYGGMTAETNWALILGALAVSGVALYAFKAK